MNEATFRFAWAHGEATVRAIGGMIAPLVFHLGKGRHVSPLHVAPWADSDDATLSPLMAGLRGEWPCLPYGPARVPEHLPVGWQACPPEDSWDHGYCANHPWRMVDQSAHTLSIAIDLPENDPVACLERHFRPDPERPMLEVELVIHPRRDAVIPFALHPTFAVPDDGIDIVGGGFRSVHTYPMPPEPGVSVLCPDATASALAALPTLAGKTLDVTHLPLPMATEELLQVSDCRPPFIVRYARAAAEVLLDWETAHLPDALLWISNGGRRHAPWSGRHYALGIEPNASCFDLTRVATPPSDHPLAHRTGLRLMAGEPVSIRYWISARDAT